MHVKNYIALCQALRADSEWDSLKLAMQEFLTAVYRVGNFDVQESRHVALVKLFNLKKEISSLYKKADFIRWASTHPATYELKNLLQVAPEIKVMVDLMRSFQDNLKYIIKELPADANIINLIADHVLPIPKTANVRSQGGENGMLISGHLSAVGIGGAHTLGSLPSARLDIMAINPHRPRGHSVKLAVEQKMAEFMQYCHDKVAANQLIDKSVVYSSDAFEMENIELESPLVTFIAQIKATLTFILQKALVDRTVDSQEAAKTLLKNALCQFNEVRVFAGLLDFGKKDVNASIIENFYNPLEELILNSDSVKADMARLPVGSIETEMDNLNIASEENNPASTSNSSTAAPPKNLNDKGPR